MEVKSQCNAVSCSAPDDTGRSIRYTYRTRCSAVHSDSGQHTSAALFAAAAVLRDHSCGDIRRSAGLRCAVEAFHRHRQSLIKFAVVPTPVGWRRGCRRLAVQLSLWCDKSSDNSQTVW